MEKTNSMGPFSQGSGARNSWPSKPTMRSGLRMVSGRSEIDSTLTVHVPITGSPAGRFLDGFRTMLEEDKEGKGEATGLDVSRVAASVLCNATGLEMSRVASSVFREATGLDVSKVAASVLCTCRKVGPAFCKSGRCMVGIVRTDFTAEGIWWIIGSAADGSLGTAALHIEMQDAGDRSFGVRLAEGTCNEAGGKKEDVESPATGDTDRIEARDAGLGASGFNKRECGADTGDAAALWLGDLKGLELEELDAGSPPAGFGGALSPCWTVSVTLATGFPLARSCTRDVPMDWGTHASPSFTTPPERRSLSKRMCAAVFCPSA
mmetsp:Transcript_70871/g.125189  ORF Transcript_70871/g.125189 Transcript_70871/m.125189 type:complete len:321 (+) Transcript_70871:1292-2254(+)